MNKSLSRRAFLRTSIASGASLAAAAAGAAPAGIYRPGTYSAKASGIGEVTVTMTFDADRIIDVVLDVSHETPGIGQARRRHAQEEPDGRSGRRNRRRLRRHDHVEGRLQGRRQVHCAGQGRNSR
ncbi:MAG: hypothetical protein ACLUNV_05330 [Sutterella wadsworthensis]